MRPEARPFMITVPAGAAPGMMLQVPTPTGAMITVQVPEGAAPGTQLSVAMPVTQQPQPAATPQPAPAARAQGSLPEQGLLPELMVPKHRTLSEDRLTLGSATLGRGTFAVVIHGRYDFRGSTGVHEVAFKCFHPDLFTCQRDVERIQQEIETMAYVQVSVFVSAPNRRSFDTRTPHIQHPNVIALHGVIGDPQASTGAGLVLEFADLGSLRQLLTAEDDETRALLDDQMRLSLARDIAEAMRFLHSLKPRPVIHRDLKSPNCACGASSRNVRALTLLSRARLTQAWSSASARPSSRRSPTLVSRAR